MFASSHIDAAQACQENGQVLHFTSAVDFGQAGVSPNAIAVSSYINTREPLTCGNGNVSTSSIWVMLAAGLTTQDGGMFAQSGYLKWAGGFVKFSEWGQNINNVDPPQLYGAPTPGNHSYQVRYSPGKHRVNMWIDLVRVDETPFDAALPPPDGWGAQPWSRQYLAETHDLGDDIPGTNGDRAIFSAMQYQSCGGCNWVPPAGIPTQKGGPRYHRRRVDDSTLQVWTDPLQ